MLEEPQLPENADSRAQKCMNILTHYQKEIWFYWHKVGFASAHTQRPQWQPFSTCIMKAVNSENSVIGKSEEYFRSMHDKREKKALKELLSHKHTHGTGKKVYCSSESIKELFD